MGHYAYIKLVLPVFHVGFFRHTIAVLQQICKVCTRPPPTFSFARSLIYTLVAKTCSRVMLGEAERRRFLKSFRRPGLENLQRLGICKQVNTLCRKVIVCPYCASINGTVKKGGPLKIVHDKFRAKKTADEMEKFKATFNSAVAFQKDLGQYLGKAVIEDLNPLKILDLFQRISDEVVGVSWK